MTLLFQLKRPDKVGGLICERQNVLCSVSPQHVHGSHDVHVYEVQWIKSLPLVEGLMVRSPLQLPKCAGGAACQVAPCSLHLHVADYSRFT